MRCDDEVASHQAGRPVPQAGVVDLEDRGENGILDGAAGRGEDAHHLPVRGR